MINTVFDTSFYKQLIRRTSLPVGIILGISLFYVVFMPYFDHSRLPFPFIVSVLAIVKTFLISRTTLRQLSALINDCQSIKQLLWVFGSLIGISVFSFATDYTCLYQYDHNVFEGLSGISHSYMHNLYHFLYFSVITFSTVGFGDISPISGVARFVVILEIFLSFFIIVFVLANIKKVHINE